MGVLRLGIRASTGDISILVITVFLTILPNDDLITSNRNVTLY